MAIELFCKIGNGQHHHAHNKKLSRDILKWAFATRILRPFQTAAHASMLRYAPVTKCYNYGLHISSPKF